jgi:hypothetical protein
MANEFKKNVGSQISKEQAEKMIAKFTKKDTKSVFFGKDVFNAIFTDSRATGVSIFFARKVDKDNKEFDDLVLVPTAEDGTLLWNSNAPQTDANLLTSGSSTYDNGYTCPPYCPK